jgi:hypothetical protein
MNGVMAKRFLRGSDGKEPRPLPSDEQGGLSARMRELILGSKLEERRKQRDGDSTGPAGERRRRSDPTANPPSRES